MKKRIYSSLILIALSGCLVGPDYKQPEIQTPDKFAEADAKNTKNETADLSQWWQQFKDPVLDGLVEEAVKNNLDLQLAVARVMEARALYGIAASADQLHADFGLQGTRSMRSNNATAFIPPVGRKSSLWQTGFDAVWEIDIFGGVERSKEAASADFDASIESLRDVLITLIGEVSRNYVEFRGEQQRLKVTRENLQTQEDTLKLTQSRFQAGITTDLDVARSEAQVATTRSQVPALEANMKEFSHRLSVLLGEEPNKLWNDLSQSSSQIQPPTDIPVGLPADLLRRRPDLRRAEREYAAATARVGVATANLYPKFSLVGFLGLQNQKFLQLTHEGSTAWSITPTMTLPILDGGRNRSAVSAENARQDQALLRYREAVLRSLEEVENSLTKYSTEQERFVSLQQAVNSNRRAVALAKDLYEKGLIDFLNVLESQRALFLVEDLYIQSQSTISTNLVSLFKSLGGGWVTDEQMEEKPE